MSGEETAAAPDAGDTGQVPATDPYSLLHQGGTDRMVRLDNGIAKRCADLVADVYYAVSSVRSYVEREGSATQPISHLPEGSVFSDKLARVTDDFLDLSDGLLKRLDIRWNALVEVGRAFEEFENENALDFGALTEFSHFVPSDAPNALYGDGTYSSDPLFSGNVYVPAPGFAMEEGEGEDRAAAAYAPLYPSVLDPTMGNVLMDPMLIDAEAAPEAAYQLTYDLGEHLRNNGIASGLTAAAATWSQIGSALNGVFENLTADIARETDGKWEGDAKDAAQALIEQDKFEVSDISPATDSMRDLYNYLAYFMGETEKEMPTRPEVPVTTTATIIHFGTAVPLIFNIEEQGPDTDRIQGYLIAMASLYTKALSEADRVIPDLSELIALMTPASVETPPISTDTDTDESSNTYTDTEGAGDNQESLSIAEGQYSDSLNPVGYSPEDMPVVDTELWEQQAQQEAAGQQLAQMIPQALSQAMNAVPQALDGLQSLQEGLTDTGLPAGIPPVGLPLGTDPSKAAGLPALKTGGPGGSLAGGSSPSSSAPKGPADVEKLFPRASLPASDSSLAGVLGFLAADNPGDANPAGSPMGSPMGGGAPGGGRGGQGGDNHERAKYLDRADNLDEALGDPPDMTRPVIGDLPARPVAPEPARSPQQPVQHQRPMPQEPVRPVRPEQPVVLPRQERG